MAAFEKQLAAARLVLADRDRPAAPGRARTRSIEAIARDLYSAELAADERDRNRSRPTVEFLDDSDDLTVDELVVMLREIEIPDLRRVATGRLPDPDIAKILHKDLIALKQRGHLTAEEGSPEWRELCRNIAAVRLEVIARQSERDRGDFSGRPALPILSAVDPTTSPTSGDNRQPDAGISLEDVMALMHKEKTNIRSATKHEQVVAVRMFVEHLVEQLPVGKISRRHAIDYKNALLETPALYAQRFKGLVLPKAITANKKRAKPFPSLSPVTINRKWLPHLASIFNWAMVNDIVDTNPFKGVRVEVGAGDAQPPRLPFSADEVRRILCSAEFQTASDERRWSVLIAAFSGMRAAEIAQLRLNGVHDERGVTVFTVDGLVKTPASRRIVPVHSALLAAGLMGRIQALQRAGEQHLFPQWLSAAAARRKAAEERGKSIQQPYSTIHPAWFVRKLLPAIGIHDGRKVFHSWRHTFKSSLARAGVSREISDALTGHTDHSVGGRYIHGVSVEALHEAVEKIIFIPHQ